MAGNPIDQAQMDADEQWRDFNVAAEAEAIQGTFGRASGANGSSSSLSNSVASLPSPGPTVRRTPSGVMAAEHSAAPPASSVLVPQRKASQRDSAPAVVSDVSRGKQRAVDGVPPRKRSSSFGQLWQADGVSEQRDQQEQWYGKPLSPRLQASNPVPIKDGDGAAWGRSSKRLRGNRSPTAGSPNERDSNPIPQSPFSSESKGYRGFERELESQQQQQQQQSLQRRFDADKDAINRDATSRATPARQAKRVSLGQVSIESGPAMDLANTLESDDEHDAGEGTSSGARNSSPRRSRRRRTVTDSARLKAQGLSTLRERTLSDPSAGVGGASPSSKGRLGDTGEYDRRTRGFWLFEGGRARHKASLSAPSPEEHRPRQMSDTAVVRPAIPPQQFLRPPPVTNNSSSTTTLPESRLPFQQQNAMTPNASTRPPSSLMRWDPALSTAISLRQGESGLLGNVPPHSHRPMQSIDDVFNDDPGAGRFSTSSNHMAMMMHNRSMAYSHLGALSHLRARFPARPSVALASIEYASWIARIHHTLLFLQVYLHVPATIFFDYNALFIISQIATHTDAGTSKAAWWIAIGVYAASFLAWLVIVVIVWEYFFSYKRRWVNKRPFALPIYLSSAAFALTSVRSYSLYSLLYRARLRATKRDFAIETAWFYGQNWPTILTLFPRAIILVVLLVMYNPTSAAPRPPGNGDAGDRRDPVYFDQTSGLLTDFSYVVLLLNLSWMAWRFLVLLTAWTSLLLLLGPRFAFQRERDAYKYEDSEMTMTSDARLSTSARPLLNPSQATRIYSPGLGGQGRPGEEDVVDMYDTLGRTPPDERKLTPGRDSIEIPRRSFSLYRDYTSVGVRSPEQVRTASTNTAGVAARGVSFDDQQRLQSHRLHTSMQSRSHSRTPSSSMPLRLPPWAWRARAEERIHSLLFESEGEPNDVGDDSWEWLEAGASPLRERRTRSGQYEGGASMATEMTMTPANVQPRKASLDMFESRRQMVSNGAPALPILSLPEESILESLSQPITTDDDADAEETHANEPGATQEAVTASGSPSDGAVSPPVTSLRSRISQASLPFPRQSQEDVSGLNGGEQEMLSSSAAVPPSKSQQSFRTPRNSFGIPVSTPSTPPVNRRSAVTSLTSGTDSMHTARAGVGRTTSDASIRTGDTVREGEKREASADHTDVSTSTEQRQRSDSSGSAAAGPSWWTGIFGTRTRSTSNPNQKSEDDSAAALSSSADAKAPNLEPLVHPPSPLSGMNQLGNVATKADAESKHPDGRSDDHTDGPTETTDTLVPDGKDEGAHPTDPREPAEDDDSISADTEDSEEKRLWQEFPEQSRRHPPGLIAFELQQQRLAEEQEALRQRRWSASRSMQSGRLDELMLGDGGSGSANGSASHAGASSASPSPPSASSSLSTPTVTPSDAVRNSSTTNLPRSSSEGLLPIQEESWSSHSATDEELEWMRRPF